MIEPVSGVQAVQLVEAAGSKTPELQQLSDKFSSLMAQDPDPTRYSEQHLTGGASPASAFVQSQEHLLGKTFDEVRSFTLQAPHLDAQTMAARHIDLQYRLAMVQVQFNAGVYVAQSGKSALQTLMKNQ